MKHITNILMGMAAAMLLLLPSCTDEVEHSSVQDERKVALSVSVAGTTDIARATVEGTGNENELKKLDVFFFDNDNNNACIYYESIGLTSTPADGKVYLATDKDTWANSNFTVYVIANSVNKFTGFDEGKSLADLQAMTETTDFYTTAPESFLMDGKSEAINGAALGDEIPVTLDRAAAKIVVNVTCGEETVDGITYAFLGASEKQIRNYATCTSLLASEELTSGQRTLRSTSRIANESTATPTRSFVFYTYANDWDITDEGSSWETLQNETYLLLNIPVTETQNGGTSENFSENYYRVTLDGFSDGAGSRLQRNHLYTITATLKTKGSSTPDTPIDLKNLNYQVRDWTEENINADKDNAQYLEVNKTEFEIRNAVKDSSLEFFSSSPVNVVVKECWYNDKFGVKRVLVANDENKTTTDYKTGSNSEEKFPASEYAPEFTADAGNTGKINIKSKLLVNTPKYITIQVTNSDGMTKEITITQYPLEYIIPVVGFQSYRTDFGGTNYNEPGPNGYTGVWNNSGNWAYKAGNDSQGDNVLFSSKYTYNYNSSTGQSKNIMYLVWNNGIRQDAGGTNNTNPNMYHIRITSASKNYKLGFPSMNGKGIVINSSENADLVSPSFMIASQLGAVYTSAKNGIGWDFDMARDHCSKYVETVRNSNGTEGTAYTGWRLPTQAELEIIKEFQNHVQSAMVVLLSGESYWGINGGDGSVLVNQGATSSGTFLRCVRDVKQQTNN